MRILVTGASGFIGGHLVSRLAGTHEVFALVRTPPAEPRGDVTYIVQDLRFPLEPGHFPKRLDALVHLAAILFTDACHDDTEPFLVNVVATWRLITYAQRAGARTFVHGSTGGIYGSRDRPSVEEDRPRPMELYSLTKAQAELAVQAAPGSLHKVILRYFFPYGAGTPNRIPDIVRRAIRGEAIEVLESRKPAINPLHISDAIEATVRSLDLDRDEVLNIAGSEITSFADIAHRAAKCVGLEPVLEPIPDELASASLRADIVGDIGRARSRLAFVPQVSLDEGVSELVGHYQGQEHG